MPSEKSINQTFLSTVLDDFLAYSSVIQYNKLIWGDPTTSRLETADPAKSRQGLLLWVANSGWGWVPIFWGNQIH